MTGCKGFPVYRQGSKYYCIVHEPHRFVWFTYECKYWLSYYVPVIQKVRIMYKLTFLPVHIDSRRYLLARIPSRIVNLAFALCLPRFIVLPRIQIKTRYKIGNRLSNHAIFIWPNLSGSLVCVFYLFHMPSRSVDYPFVRSFITALNALNPFSECACMHARMHVWAYISTYAENIFFLLTVL